MITHLYIDNFKTLIDFNMSCHNLTCLIGLNNSGKTTIVQAIDFLSYVASGQVLNFLKLKNWDIEEIKSYQLTGKQSIKFNLVFHLNNNTYSWSGEFLLKLLFCKTERIIRKNNNEEVLLDVNQDSYQLDNRSLKSIDFAYEGSILAFLKEKLLTDELIQVKHFLTSIKSLDLLNPQLLIKPSKKIEQTMMYGGENLAGFLSKLSNEQKEKVSKQLRHLFKKFDNFQVKTNDSGRRELSISEKTRIDDICIDSKHMSDGFLRLFAIFSQLQTDYSVLLFDEIENGLNHELIEYVLDEMLISKKQIILTTHSPMILNFLEDDIALQSVKYIKNNDETGITFACNFFETPEVKAKLDYMGPGEIYANIDLKEVL
jgi:predicted ATPase